MKKIIILVMGIMLIASPLFAAAITDATKPLGHLKWSLGAEDNFIFDKDVEKPADRAKFDVEDINQVYAKASVGLTPYFNLYAKLGASNAGEIDTTSNVTGMALKIESEYGLLWGVGLSGAKEIMDGWKIGADAQISSTKADIDKVTLMNSTAATNVSGEIENYELQITPFITRKIAIDKWSINPYLGCVVNFFWTETDNPLKYNLGGLSYSEGWARTGDNNVGVVVGSDLEVNEKVAINLEGRFVDETAITAGAVYKF